MPKQDLGKEGPNLREPPPLRSPGFPAWLNGREAAGSRKEDWRRVKLPLMEHECPLSQHASPLLSAPSAHLLSLSLDYELCAYSRRAVKSRQIMVLCCTLWLSLDGS